MSQDGWQIEEKTAVVTGATSGLGKLAALALAEQGARLFLVCRNPDRATRVAGEITDRTGNANMRLVIADLSVQAEVRHAADQVLSTGEPVHVLLNNAGAMFGFRRHVSQDGHEMTFALNHLAYFTLTLLLLGRLRQAAPGRIVNVASGAYRDLKGGFDFDDVNAERRYSPYRQYAMSKLANILFTLELARRLDPASVTANAADPGRTTRTRFAHNVHPLVRAAMLVASPFLLSPAKGVRSLVHLCTAPELERMSGTFWSGMRQAKLLPTATNGSDAARLWELSTLLTGIAER